MAVAFQPPPTYASPVLVDERTKQSQFNPIWLKWFLDLAAFLTASGGGSGGAAAHNDLSGLQGGSLTERFHITASQAADLPVYPITIAKGGTGVSLTDPNADRILFWDDSASSVAFLSPGAFLTITGTILDVTGISSGTYTPTLTNVVNISASTAYQAQYLQVGNTVTVSGRVDIDPVVTATATQLGISVPVASNFGATEDCGGCATAPFISDPAAAILADAVNDRAQLEFVSNTIANHARFYIFQYQVI